MKTEKASAFITALLETYNKMCKKPEDYYGASCLTTHDKAVRKLSAIREELENDHSLAKDVYSELLKNEDEYIRVDAAWRCVELGILEKNALSVVNDTIAHGTHSNAFLAKIVLRIWRGEIEPNKPWTWN